MYKSGATPLTTSGITDSRQSTPTCRECCRWGSGNCCEDSLLQLPVLDGANRDLLTCTAFQHLEKAGKVQQEKRAGLISLSYSIAAPPYYRISLFPWLWVSLTITYLTTIK